MLQIVKSIIESSSDSSSSDDEDIFEILSAFNEEKGHESSVSDENDNKGPRPRKRSKYDLKNLYFKDIINSSFITSEDFKAHFCISRSSFEELLVLISSPHVTAGRPPVPVKDALLITMWILLNQEPYRSIADRFSISVGHCVRLYHETCAKLCKASRRYIVWPEGKDALDVVKEFNAKSENKLAHVFGCVGTTHLLIPSSQIDITYYDCKGNHSVVLQGVCDSNGIFMNINVGSPGSWPNSSIWRNSAVYAKLCEDADFIPSGCYLVGDSSYPLDEFIMVPFKDKDGFNNSMKQFNIMLSVTHDIVHRAFGRLKGLFKRLKFLNILKIDNIKHIVTAACILHNLSVRDGVICDDFELPYLNESEMDPTSDVEQNKKASLIRLSLMNEILS